LRHVVERGRKRLEFGKPGFVAGAHVQLAAAERAAVRTSARIGRTMSRSPPNQAMSRTSIPNSASCT
jgi:hypothetical protein